ncbi:MAG: hypothetical protein Kow00121_12060 [Elainellaceae cyanobacterium]
MTCTLAIRLFGELSLTYDDRPVAGVSRARSQALLSYLVLNRHTPQPRQRLAFDLWTDSADAQARANLRRELTYLRRALPHVDQFLWIESKTLQWSPTAPFILDVMTFEEALSKVEAADSDTKQALLKQAIVLYRGDLLSSCEDEWIVPERERLRQQYISALEQLIDQLQTQQDYRQALNYAQQLLHLDVLSEATYCTLMRLYNQNGDRANALQIYHRCMKMLREELGVDPSPTTRKLYKQLLLQDELPTDTVFMPPPRSLVLPIRSTDERSSSSPLIGREQEWSEMQAWVDCTSRDTPAPVLLLTGEPGIGKTRLLEELRDTIPLILWGRAFAAEMVRPYGIWIDALRSVNLPSTLPSELGFLLPEVGQPVTIPPDRSRLFDAVVQLLTEWAATSPVVVILDDIHWIDEASSALLHYAIRLLGDLPVRFSCTARSGELEENPTISQVVQALRRDRRLRTLELQPLDRAQTAELICSVQTVDSSSLSAEVVDQVFSDSGGNPLFALEVARTLSPNHTAHGDTLESLIRDRLQQLESHARELLSWAAAFGRSFKPTTIAQVANYPMPQLLRAIEQLERQSIIRPSALIGNEMGYDFAHDIVRQVVYQQLSEPRRQLVHLQIAHQLNQRTTLDNALAGDIAHHAALGGDCELAASTALLAAQRCLKLFAYAEAAVLAQRGIQYCQSLEARTRIRLQLELFRVWMIAGVTGDRATEIEANVQCLIAEANQLGLKDDEVIGLEALWVLYFNQNDFNSLHHSIQAMNVNRVVSPAAAARLLSHSGACLAEVGRDMVRAEALLLEAQSLAARIGLDLCDIDSGLGRVHLHYGRYDEARPLLQQAWQLTQIEQDHWHGCTYLSYLAMVELETDNPTAALPYCEEMTIVAARIQVDGSEGAMAAALAALANYQLQQLGADAALEQAIITLQQVDAKRMLSYVLIGAAKIDLKGDRPQLAVVRAETALQAAQTINHPSEIALAWAILIQAMLTSGAQKQAIAKFEWLQDKIDRHALSARARSAVDRTIDQMQKFISTSSGKSTKNS